MDSKELTRVHEEKDLGVLLNDKLSVGQSYLCDHCQGKQNARDPQENLPFTN